MADNFWLTDKNYGKTRPYNLLVCLNIDEFEADFDDIIADVVEADEIFGVLPTPNLGAQKMDIFMPVVILMSIDKFWVPEYFMAAAKNEI